MNDNPLESPAILNRPGMLDRGVTLHKTAEILGYSYTTVYRMVKSGDLESYGSGKKLRVYENSIHRYRQQSQNGFGNMPKIRDRVRSTGPRYRQAIKDLDALLR